MTRPVGSSVARRRSVGVVGVLVLVATLLTTTGVAAQQDDLPKLSITPKTVSVREDAGTITFRATLSKTSTQDVTFGYNLREDNEAEHEATFGEDVDYPAGSSAQVTIAAGETSASIVVEIKDDSLDEHDEEVFILEPTGLTNAELSDSIAQYNDEERTFLRGHWVTVTIRDNDDPPKLMLANLESSTTESGRYLRYQLSLSAPSGKPVRVPYEVLPGLARNSNGDLIDEDDCGSFTDRDVCQPATPRDDQGKRPDYGRYLHDGQAWSTDGMTLEGEYVFEPGEITYPDPGAFDFAEISIDVVNDEIHDVNDRDETLTLRLLPDPSFTFATNEDRSAEGLILDDDLPRVVISQFGAGYEGPWPASFGVSLSHGAIPTGGDPVVVGYRAVENIDVPNWYEDDQGDERGTVRCSATVGEDYELEEGTLTFTAGGSRSATVNYMKLDDEIAEPIEVVCMELFYPPPDAQVQDPPPPNFLLPLNPAWSEIIFDDEDPPNVTVSSPTVNEGAGTMAFGVRLTRPDSNQQTFYYETQDGTATTADGDYTSKSGRLTFPPNSMTPTQSDVRVTIRDDNLDETEENLKLVVKDADQNFTVAEGTGYITDNDSEPSLSVADVRADEDNSDVEIVFTVRLSPASAKEVTVAYATSDGTATEPADYTATGNVLVFAPGEREMKVPVTIVDDTLYEGDETFTLTLSSPNNAQLPDATATGTIVENESAPSLSVANVTGEESAGFLEFQVTLGSQSGSTVTVDYETEQLTGTNRATQGTDCSTASVEAGADFAEKSETLTFNPGDVTHRVFVTLCSDNLDEESETFRFKLSNESGAPVTSGGRTATGTILDSDEPPELSVAAAPVAEGAGPMQFTVTLSTASAKTVTVRYATTDVTATAGRDFTAPSSSARLTFSPGDTEETISVPVTDDSLDEDDSETFRLLLSSPSNAALQSGGDAATGTITDNDDLPLLSISGGRAREDATALNSNNGVVFTVELDAVSGRDVSVDYRTFGDTADTAESGLDYTPTSGDLTIPAGQRRGTVTVPVLNDTLDEDAETFTMELTNPQNTEFAGQAGSVSDTGTIIDDNDPETDLQIENVTVNEGGGSVTFQVTLREVSGQVVTVDYQTVNGTATVGSDCTVSGDFLEASGTLTFPVGKTTPTEVDPSVTICDDSLDEPYETFGLRLRNPRNATAPADAATGLIEDNDPEPNLSVDDPRVVEGAGNIEFTVTLSPASGKQVAVDYVTVDGTGITGATAPGDYTAKSGSLTFDPGETTQTVVVTVRDDQIAEGDETFTLELSGQKNASANVDFGTATIADDEGEPGLRVNDIEVSERAGTVSFTVTLEPISSAPVTVSYATMDGTATEPDDYTATDGQLEFDAGESTMAVEVDIFRDDVAEEDETFTLVLSGAVGADLDDDTGKATITERRITRPPPPRRTPPPDDDDDDDGGGGTPQPTTQQSAAPRIGVFLQDVVLVLGDPPRNVGLVASVVGSIDTYRALAADPRIVTAVVNGSKLTLNPVALGVTTVSVSATNGRGAAFQSFRVTVIERGAPRFVSLLPDRVMTVGDPPLTVDVAPAFAGTVRSYRSTAGDPGVLRVAVNGSHVSLTALAPGVTTVMVNATNVNGAAMQTFRVTVRSRATPGTTPLGPLQEIPTH